jgi:nucleoid DNA-binding protein
MNKGELVDAIATKTEMSKKQIDQVLSAILEVIQETVAGGEKLPLWGLAPLRQDIVQRVKVVIPRQENR